MIPSLFKDCSWIDKNGNTLILIKVRPNSKNSAVIGLIDVKTNYPVKKALSVAIAAQAEDNKANKELIDFLSTELNVKKSSITLEYGEKNRVKVLRIPA
jgi:uncharacterized protein (TIGR00251 family)